MMQTDHERINFYKRLNALGYFKYNDYLKSPHWKEKKEEYKNSDRPKYCLNCKDKNYILHHRSYVRIGDESLSDLIPLCQKCHNKIHTFFNKNRNIPLSATHSVFGKVFGYSRKQTRTIFSHVSLVRKKKKCFKFKDRNKIDILAGDNFPHRETNPLFIRK